MSVKKTEAEVRDSIRDQLGKEVPYRPFNSNQTRKDMFQLVAKLEGVELFDNLVVLLDDTITRERATLAEQVITDLGKIEYYVNNAGWDTEERRGREISTIWGLRDKYRGLTEEQS